MLLVKVGRTSERSVGCQPTAGRAAENNKVAIVYLDAEISFIAMICFLLIFLAKIFAFKIDFFRNQTVVELCPGNIP